MILGFDIWAVVYLVVKIILWSDPPAQDAWTWDNFSGRLVHKWSSPVDSWFGHDLVNTETIWTNPCGIIRSNISVTSGRSRADWELAGKSFLPKSKKFRLKSPRTHTSRPVDRARSIGQWKWQIWPTGRWLLRNFYHLLVSSTAIGGKCCKLVFSFV